jgi:hypothetical protein
LGLHQHSTGASTQIKALRVFNTSQVVTSATVSLLYHWTCKMVIGLIKSSHNQLNASSSWYGSGSPSSAAQMSDPGSSKDPVVRLSQMLGQTSLIAEHQHSLKKCLQMAQAAALAAFDAVGFLESLAVCSNKDSALQKHQVHPLLLSRHDY